MSNFKYRSTPVKKHGIENRKTVRLRYGWSRSPGQELPFTIRQ